MRDLHALIKPLFLIATTVALSCANALAKARPNVNPQANTSANRSGTLYKSENFSNHIHAPEQKPKVNNNLQGPFYFVDENPLQIIKILEDLSGKIAITSANLPNIKINFTSKGKLHRDEAILAIKSLLGVNGIAIVDLGEKFFKASAAQGVNTQAPVWLKGKATDLPPSQTFYSKFYELEYADIETLAKTLESFVSGNGISTLALFPRSNAFFLTDSLVNHQRIENLISKIDCPPLVREEIEFFMLKNVSAEDAKRRIATFQNDALKKYFQNTSIEADDRTNQLIVISSKGNMQYIKKLVESLDIEAQPLTKSAVFYIRHGESKDVASVLNQIVKGQQSAVKSNNAAEATRVAATNRQNMVSNNQNRQAIQQGTRKAQPTNMTADPQGAALQFSEYVTIVADERSNSIVAYGTSTDLMQIEDIIKKVDVVLAQVKIDVIITEVTLTDKQVSGLTTFGLDFSKKGVTSTNGKSVEKGWSANTSTGALDGVNSNAFSLALGENGFSAIFNVAETNSKVKILSSPSIVTTHNKEAIINVSRQYPFINATTTYNTGNYPSTQNQVDWQDIGVILEVTPLIGNNGVVQLDIKQTVSSVIDYMVINDTQQAIKGTREAESFISVKDGETIVLAGLQQQEASDSDQAVWLLSDIPLIGEIFKPTNDSRTRTELVMFIRPTIIKSSLTEEMLNSDLIKDSPIKKELDQYLKTGRFYDPKVDGFGQGETKHSSAVRTILPKDKDEEIFINPHESETKVESKEDATKSVEKPTENKEAKSE